MSNVLLATDADWIFDQVSASLARPGSTVSRVRAGHEVEAAVAEIEPELVVLDLQIGNMGGAACARHLRLEAGAGRLPETAILLLLDRDAKVRSLALQALVAQAKLVPRAKLTHFAIVDLALTSKDEELVERAQAALKKLTGQKHTTPAAWRKWWHAGAHQRLR